MNVKKMLALSLFIMVLLLNSFHLSAAEEVVKKKTRKQIVQEAALEIERRHQRTGAGIDTRTLAEIETIAGRNRFTQTEAYFQIPELRDLVMRKYDIVPYMNVISQMLANEGRYRDTHWAFYHGSPGKWRVAQDLFTKLYYHFNKTEAKSDEFAFLRFENESGPHVQEFLLEQLKTNGLVDDTGDVKAFLLSTNLSIFGNSHSNGESSWRYFVLPKSHELPDPETYENMMKKFGLTTKYVIELMNLEKIFHTKEQSMIQVFVPKNVVDEIGYLSWMRGIPAHEEIINWVRTNLKNKVFKGKAGKPGRTWAAMALTDKFKKEQDRNPIFRDLVQSIEEGDYSLDSYLKIYCNKPSELPNLDYAQARLIFTPEILLNPESGIKIYRFNTVPHAKMKEYNKRLDQIVQKIIAEGVVNKPSVK